MQYTHTCDRPLSRTDYRAMRLTLLDLLRPYRTPNGSLDHDHPYRVALVRLRHAYWVLGLGAGQPPVGYTLSSDADYDNDDPMAESWAFSCYGSGWVGDYPTRAAATRAAWAHNLVAQAAKEA